jgi:hypothetical protein
MLFALVCGKFPIGCDATNEHDLIMAVVEGNYAIPEGYTDNPGRRLIQSMLCKQPEKRLGAGLQGWGEIKSNKFFQGGMSGHLFDKLLGREIEPPVIPPTEMYSEEGLVETVTLSDSELLGNGEDDIEDPMDALRSSSPEGFHLARPRLATDGDASPRSTERKRSHSPKLRHRKDRDRAASPAEPALTPAPPSVPRRGPARPSLSRADVEAEASKIDDENGNIEEGRIVVKLRDEVATARGELLEVSTQSSLDAGEGEKRVDRGAA